jgi:thioredoxin-related protein
VSFMVNSAFVISDKNSKGINWISWEELEKAQINEPRKVFVDVYTEWCGWCKKMDKETFTNPAIVDYINKNYYAVKFDAETRAKINFRGKEYKYTASGNRGYNQLAYELLGGRLSYPTTVYLDEKLNLITAVPGYLTAPTLDAILTYFHEGHYLTVKWEDFEKQFKSKLK